MSTRPVIFISAVSTELRSARDLVAKTLFALGYDPKWQDIAPTETGDLRGVLRKWVDDSAAVLQLVGHCYGFAPKDADAEFGPCSYTQYEALYGLKQRKPVYYLFIDDTHPTDGCGCEPKTLHDLQEKYRQQVKAHGALFHSTGSLTQTELLVRRLKDELAQLRKRGRQHAALVLALLIVLVFGGVWMTRKQSDSNQNISLLLQQNQELKNGQADLRHMIETSIQGGSESKLSADYDAALRFIADKRGIALGSFRSFLDQNATQALGDVAVSLKDKVRALQEAGQFVQSRDFALEQARRLESERHQSSKEEADLWTEAAKTELILGHYGRALEYATKAVSQADRQTDFLTWSAARHQQGRALSYGRKDQEAQGLYEELIPLQQAAFGRDDIVVIQSRRLLSNTLWNQGRYAQAEQQERALVADCQRVLGAEHPETLAGRSNLATTLDEQGKHAEAEQEHRAVLQIKLRLLGAEHPETLMNCMGVANALQAQGKYAEAEQENREVLQIRARVLGAEHPDTLASRNNLALALQSQGKYAEAEQEHRARIKIEQRVLGFEHPDTLMSRMNLAFVLNHQRKHVEAEVEHRAVLQIKQRVLVADHPAILESRMGLANALQSQGKQAEAEQEYRQVLHIRMRDMGAEHPSTLESRMYLASAVDAQGQHAEAEQDLRAVVLLQERLLGAEHSDVAESCACLATCTKAQNKLPEALGFMQRAEQLRTKILGPEHPDTKDAKTERESIEAAIKLGPTQ